MNTNKYKVLDLFCGAGGLSLGFKNAGFEIYGAVDFDAAAMNTHNKNFDTKYHYCGDICQITNKEIEENLLGMDVIIGGPPCQGFSSANRYLKDEEDPRNKLFFEYLRFIERINPKVFVIENVKGILTRDNGYAKNKIIKITEKLGYSVSVDVLSAEKYGVPQKRQRAFFVGVRLDQKEHFEFKKIKPIFEQQTVSNAIDDLKIIENGENVNTLLEIERTSLQNYFVDKQSNVIHNHEITRHSDVVVERIKHVPEGGNWSNVPVELWKTQRSNRHSSAYKRLDSKEPSITIDTGHMNYFHPVFNRVPTVRESARIQTFQDSFVFFGSKTEQYRQVGNAVPPILAQAIAKLIMKLLGG